MGKKIGQKVPKNAKKSQNTLFLISTARKLLDQSKNVTVRTYHKLSKDQNGQKVTYLLYCLKYKYSSVPNRGIVLNKSIGR